MFTLEFYNNKGRVDINDFKVDSTNIRDVYNLIYSIDLDIYAINDIQYVEIYRGGSLVKTYII